MSMELFAKIGKAAPASNGGNKIKPGKGRVAVLKLTAKQGYKGASFISSFQVVTSQQTDPAQAPNAPGTSWDKVEKLDHEGADGRIKAMVRTLFGVQKVTPELIVQVMARAGVAADTARAHLTQQLPAAMAMFNLNEADALDTLLLQVLCDGAQPARGMLLDYETYEFDSKKGFHIVAANWTHVPGQTEESIRALRAKLDAGAQLAALNDAK